MSSNYTITTDKASFRQALFDVFEDREILTMMSVIVSYNNAINTVSENSPTARINYYEMCKDAEDDGIDRFAVRTLLEKLSISRFEEVDEE